MSAVDVSSTGGDEGDSATAIIREDVEIEGKPDKATAAFDRLEGVSWTTVCSTSPQ